MPNQDIWNSILITIMLNLLYNDFDIIIKSILKQKKKLINKI